MNLIAVTARLPPDLLTEYYLILHDVIVGLAPVLYYSALYYILVNQTGFWRVLK